MTTVQTEIADAKVARILVTKVGKGRYHVVTVNADGWSTGYRLVKSQRQACQIAARWAALYSVSVASVAA